MTLVAYLSPYRQNTSSCVAYLIALQVQPEEMVIETQQPGLCRAFDRACVL